MYAFLAKLARHRRRRRQASHSTLPRPRSFRLERYDTVSERESRGRIAIDSEIKDNVVDLGAILDEKWNNGYVWYNVGEGEGAEG